MRGRKPSKLTPETRDRILLFVRNGNTKKAAAEAAGIDEATLYRWIQRGDAGEHPYGQFVVDFRRAIAEWQAGLVARIIQAATVEGKWQAAAWLLERRDPANWGLVQSVELSGKGGGAIEHVHELSRRVVEDAGAADLAHELLERVAGHAGRSRLDSLPGLLDPGPAPAPAEQAPD